MSDDPQAPLERRAAARHLLANPICCKEHDPDAFRLIRRHETELDRWFTQRLGYRLHLGADTARLFKSGALPLRRPMRTKSGRAFHRLEYVMLLLAVAATVAGPAVVSLRDLVDLVRSAAADAEVPLAGDAAERRALVTALRFLIDRGLAIEVHARVEEYADDAEADAVLRLRPDRIALLSLPALAGFADAADLLARAVHRSSSRQWMRARLVEDPVLYRDDVSESEWAELRRRLGEEERFLEEMFGLTLETRAEGIAAVDAHGELSDEGFPAGGTVGHAALLLITSLRNAGAEARPVPLPSIVSCLADLARTHARHWSRDLAGDPELLARRVLALLEAMRLAEPCDGGGNELAGGAENCPAWRLLPAAARFAAEAPRLADTGPVQGRLDLL
ncbi:MAG TPA: TIGR02678 family protein [Acidimicrobiales bacterium]|nr:TIGR02678 family protein [Acidimicrobiales bacterium]